MQEFQRYLFSPEGLVLTLALITYIRARRSASIVSRALKQGGVYIDNASLPGREYYKNVAQRVADRKINNLYISIRTLPENSPFMVSREYLKIGREPIQFYVCTFELGTSQVFTYWQIAPLDFGQHLIGSIPLIGRIPRALFFPTTLYKIEIGTEKGVRELGQADLQAIRQIVHA